MEKILFYHGKTVDGKRFTIAGRYWEDEIILGISICGGKDRFNKRYGRDKATGRSFANIGTQGKGYINLYGEYSTENYWVGQEINIFINNINRFDKMTFRELKQYFNLND